MLTSTTKNAGLLVMVLIAALTGLAIAQDKSKADKSAEAKADENRFVVDVINIPCTLKNPKNYQAKIATPDENGKLKWRKVIVGDTFSEGQIIRTGFGTSVVLRFSGNDDNDARGRTTINPNTKIGFSVQNRQGMNCQSQLRIKYGSIKAEIDSTGGKKNDYRVRTPGGTLSARGTGGNIGYNVDSRMGISGKHGKWALVAPNGLRQTIRRGQRGNSKATPSKTLLAEELGSKVADLYGFTGKEQEQIDTNPPVFEFNPGTTSQMGGNTTSPGTGLIGRHYTMYWSGQGSYETTARGTNWTGSGSYEQAGVYGSWSGSGTVSGYSSDGSMAGANLTGSGSSSSINTGDTQTWTGTFHADSGSISPVPTGPGSTGTWNAQGKSFTGDFPGATPDSSSSTSSSATAVNSITSGD